MQIILISANMLCLICHLSLLYFVSNHRENMEANHQPAVICRLEESLINRIAAGEVI
jgi:hypothetical protein